MWALWLGNNIYSILFYIWCKFPPCTFAMRRTLISFCLIISSLNVLSTPALDEWHCSYACTSTVVMGRTLDLPSVIELAPWTYKMVYCYFGVQKKLIFIYLFFFYFYFLGPIWLSFGSRFDMGPIWLGADLTWGRFDWGRFDWGRFDLGPIWLEIPLTTTLQRLHLHP
jgi:hypothetical protein